MRELDHILGVYQQLDERGDEQVVLGTLVDLRGSGYRRPGARILMTSSHERAGLISGGCLERDVMRQAWALTKDGPCLALYDTRGDELHPQGPYGTGCDGLVTLLLERLPPEPSRIDPLSELADLHETLSGQLAMATIYGVAEEVGADSALGARLALRAGHTADASRKRDEAFPEHLEAMILPELEKLDGASRAVSVHAQGYTVLLETFLPPTDLLVFGDGDDVIPLVELAATMGWRPRVVGKWPARVTRARFTRAHSLCLLEKESLEDITIHKNTHVLLMTHDFDWDVQLLPMLLASEARHIGLLGPRRRTMNLLEQMRDRGVLPTPSQLERLETPIGLALGADAPEEVALSIIASIVARRNGREGGRLSREKGAIHAPHERRALVTAAAEDAS